MTNRLYKSMTMVITTELSEQKMSYSLQRVT